MVARAAAEDIAVESLAVRAGDASALRGAAIGILLLMPHHAAGKGVVGGVGVGVGPGVALVERSRGPIRRGVWRIEVFCIVIGPVGIPSAAYLSVLNGDVGVGKHVSVLCTAEDRTLDERAAAMVGLADDDIGFADEVKILDDGVGLCVAGDTLAAAKHHAADHGHRQHTGSHRAAVDFHGGETGTCSAGGGGTIFVARIISHRGYSAATINVAPNTERVVVIGIHPTDGFGRKEAHCDGVDLLVVAHQHPGIGGDQTGIIVFAAAVATAEDIMVDVSIHKEHQRRGGRGVGGTILCHIAATIDIVDIQGASECFERVNDDSDFSLHIAVLVAAAKDRANIAALQDDGNVAASFILSGVRCQVSVQLRSIFALSEGLVGISLHFGLRGVFLDIGSIGVGTHGPQ